MVRLVTSLFAAGLALTALAHAETADDRFKALYQKEWTWREEQFPGQDDEDRESKPTDNRLTDVGADAQSMPPSAPRLRRPRPPLPRERSPRRYRRRRNRDAPASSGGRSRASAVSLR